MKSWLLRGRELSASEQEARAEAQRDALLSCTFLLLLVVVALLHRRIERDLERSALPPPPAPYDARRAQ